MENLRYKPAALFRLDDDTPFVDYSGYSRSGTRTGTENKAIALVPSAAYSQVLSSSNVCTFATPVYNPGKEEDEWSIAAVFYPLSNWTTAGSIGVVSNLNKTDGLSVNGTIVSFSTSYTGNGDATCSYDVEFYQRIDAVGVHTKTKNSLYINGVLVAEVDVTTAQQASTYNITNNNLYSGYTTSDKFIAVNNVAVYPKALLNEDVIRLYAINNRRVEGEVPKQYGGEVLYVSSDVRPQFIDTGWFTNDDWDAAQKTNVSAEAGRLVPDMFDGLTLKGVWQDSVNLYDGETPTALNSVNLMWSGMNVTIEASIDGTTWITAQRGVNLSIIPTGFDPTNKALYIKVTFTEGVAEAWLDNLQVNGYLTNVVTPPSGRSITYTNPIVTYDEYPAMALRENWGVNLIAGTLAFGADTSGEVYNARTIEVWLKKNTASAPTLSFSPTTTYVNGISGGTSDKGEWAIYHYVLSSNASTFSFTGTVTIGRVAIYDTALSAGTIASIVSSYTGIPTTRVDDTSIIAVSEPSTSAVIYAHDWEIVSS